MQTAAEKCGVDSIIRWEAGEMDENETIEFFQALVDTGLAWELQGCYGRQAAALIRAGLIKPAGRETGTDRGNDAAADSEHFGRV